MKKIIYLSLILSLSLFSCRKTPQAQFSTDNTKPEVGQEVLFTNESDNAVDYEWDFGDGFISNEVNPVHIFAATGTFEVTLTATSKSGISDKTSLTITVMIPTLLDIEVREYWKEYTIPDASVRLYPDSTSWDNEENMVSEGYSDADGVVVFSNLDPKKYYVDVWKQNFNNYTLRSEDVGFITTDKIELHKINFFIAWVDSVGTGKGRLNKSLVIDRLERKVMDKNTGLVLPGTNGWKALYDKSIRLK